MKRRRQELELSAEGLAKFLCKSTGYVQLVEAGKRGVDLKELPESRRTLAARTKCTGEDGQSSWGTTR